MATIIINDNSAQAKQLIEYLKTLPFAKVIEDEAKSFEEAAEECEAVTVNEFINELREQVDKYYKGNA